MIRYLGGKTRFSKDIVATISKYVEHQTNFHEPFFGGGSIAKYSGAMHLNRFAYDIHPDLILMYQELQKGWLPPEEISEELYKELKTSSTSALRAYVGFSCSFGGKWFGGYARDAKGRRKLDAESYNRLNKELYTLEGIRFSQSDFNMLSFAKSDVVYCDPPYAATTGYIFNFNHAIFWDKVREWVSSGALVFVSEYSAPPDFTCVWSRVTKTYMHHKTTVNNKVEKLFMLKDIKKAVHK